jgi:hypothetical protein
VERKKGGKEEDGKEEKNKRGMKRWKDGQEKGAMEISRK